MAFAATQTKEEAKTKQSRLVVCVTGMPGAGKSTIAEVGQGLGYEVFRMGDDVRMEAEKRNVQPNDANLGAIMMELRQKSGPVAIARLCEQRIEKDSKSKLIIIDGIRNVNEFIEFRKLGNALLIAVHTSPLRRFNFLKERGRTDSPSDFKSFEARDRRELSVGVGEAIALADDILVNSGTLAELKTSAAKLLQTLKQSK